MHAVATDSGRCVRLITRQQHSFPSMNLSTAHQFKQLDCKLCTHQQILVQINHFVPRSKALLQHQQPYVMLLFYRPTEFQNVSTNTWLLTSFVKH